MDVTKHRTGWEALPSDVAEWMGMWEPPAPAPREADVVRVPAQRTWRERLRRPVA